MTHKPLTKILVYKYIKTPALVFGGDLDFGRYKFRPIKPVLK